MRNHGWLLNTFYSQAEFDYRPASQLGATDTGPSVSLFGLAFALLVSLTTAAIAGARQAFMAITLKPAVVLRA
jgi:hypothetical protein